MLFLQNLRSLYTTNFQNYKLQKDFITSDYELGVSDMLIPLFWVFIFDNLPENYTSIIKSLMGTYGILLLYSNYFKHANKHLLFFRMWLSSYFYSLAFVRYILIWTLWIEDFFLRRVFSSFFIYITLTTVTFSFLSLRLDLAGNNVTLADFILYGFIVLPYQFMIMHIKFRCKCVPIIANTKQNNASLSFQGIEEYFQKRAHKNGFLYKPLSSTFFKEKVYSSLSTHQNHLISGEWSTTIVVSILGAVPLFFHGFLLPITEYTMWLDLVEHYSDSIPEVKLEELKEKISHFQQKYPIHAYLQKFFIAKKWV